MQYNEILITHLTATSEQTTAERRIQIQIETEFSLRDFATLKTINYVF